MVLTDIFCYAQKTGGDFLRMQDSLYALHQLPGHSTFNAKPFFSSGNIVKGSTGRNKFTGILTRPDNTICFDTSRRSFLFNDTAIFYTRNPYPSADGNFFLSGDYVRTTSPYNSGGFLAKLDHKGTILWHRTYTRTDGPGNAYVNFYRVIELHDGSVFLAGSTYDRVTGNNDIMLAKTDFQGNLTWSKIYNSRLWGTGSGSTDYYYVQQMKEDPATNEIYLAGPTWSDGRTMMKVSSMNGNIAWSKAYEAGGHFDNPFGFDIKPGELRLFSKSVDNYAVISMTRINKLTGDTIACRYWKSEDTAGIKVDFLGTNPLTILDNGNYVLTGSSYGNYIYLWNGITAFYQASVVEFDNNFNFIKAYNFRNAIESNSYNTKISTYPDGNSFFTMLHIYSGYTADVYSVQLMNGQIVKQRVKLTQVGIPYEPIAVKAPDGGDLIMRLIGDTSDGINKIELLNMHASDTSSVCFGISDNSTYLYPFNVIPTHYYTSQVQSDIFQETTNYSVSTAILADHYLPGCAQVSHCDSIKLLPSAVVLCPSQALQITGRKNIGCGSNIAWRFNSTGIASSSQPNDSTLLLQFSGPWTGYVYGSILGCSVITDSVFITVIQAPVSLNLGDDFNICPGNTRLLNAQAGYASYLWQDGSTASTFLVMSPGTYNVTATDACGVIFMIRYMYFLMHLYWYLLARIGSNVIQIRLYCMHLQDSSVTNGRLVIILPVSIHR